MVMATHLALLRGINVGGKNKLLMTSLVELFSEAGCKNVRTFIQSGNVVFTASPTTAARVADRVTSAIAVRFGYRTPVIVRTVENDSRDVSLNNPYVKSGIAPDQLYLMFLAEVPAPANVQRLDPGRSAPDAFQVRGQEIYLHLPKGVANSKLTNAYFDSTLSTTSTSRNWRTVTRLLGLMESGS